MWKKYLCEKSRQISTKLGVPICLSWIFREQEYSSWFGRTITTLLKSINVHVIIINFLVTQHKIPWYYYTMESLHYVYTRDYVYSRDYVYTRDVFFEKRLMWLIHQPLFKEYPDWYPSLVSSGTLWSTRAHQARVLIWINKLKRELIHQFLLKIPRLVPKFGGLGYFTKYPSPPSSGTKLDEFDKRLRIRLFSIYFP